MPYKGDDERLVCRFLLCREPMFGEIGGTNAVEFTF